MLSLDYSRSRFLGAVCIALLILALSFSSVFKYLNFPAYDVVQSWSHQHDSAPTVALITSSDFSQFSDEELSVIYSTIGNYAPTGILFLSYPERNNAALLDLADKASVTFGHAVSPSVDNKLVKHTIPSWVNKTSATMSILTPQAEVDGIVRSFNAQRYHGFGLGCSECKIVEKLGGNISEPNFFINYRLGQSNLPIVNAVDILQGSLPLNLLRGKFIVIANETSELTGSYPAAIGNTKSISFPYYVASVIDTKISSEQIKRLNWRYLAIILVLIGILVPFTVRYLTATQYLALCLAAVPVSLLASFASLSWFKVYIPVIEPCLTFACSVLFVGLLKIKKNDESLLAMASAIESKLGTSSAPQLVAKTDLCANLFNLFNRSIQVSGIKLYHFNGEHVDKIVAFDNRDIVEPGIEPTKDELKSFKEPKPHLLLSHKAAKGMAYVALPINKAKSRLGIIILEVENKTVETVSRIYENYRDEIYNDIDKWLENNRGRSKNDTQFHNQANIQRLNRSLETVIKQQNTLKQNFNAQVATVVAYDIYGSLTSLNAAAERFAKQTNMVWYDRTLAKTLAHLTQWSDEQSKSFINSVIIDKQPKMFTVKAGSQGDYLATLSIDTAESDSDEQKSVEKTHLILEIGNISKISQASRLKHTFVTDLTDQVKHDLSKAITMVEKESMLEGDADKYHDLLEVLDRLGGRLKISKQYIEDLAHIDNSLIYPVDVANVSQAALEKLEEKFVDKGVRLIFKRPAFLNLIALDYRELSFVITYLTELLLKDSIKNTQLEVAINEKNKGNGIFVHLSLTSSGYGLPQELLENKAGIDDELTANLARCETFSLISGGNFSINSVAGEGIRVDMDLPITREIH